MRQQGCQAGPAPCAAALHGAHGHIKDASGLRHRIPLHVHEDERRALLGGEGGQRGEEFAVEIVAFRGGLRGLMRLQQPVEPLRVVDGRGLPGRGLADAVEAGVHRDAVQPGGDGGLAPEGVGGAEGGDQGVLYGVGRFLAVAQRPQGHGPQPVAMASSQLAEGIGVTGDMLREEVRVARWIGGTGAVVLTVSPSAVAIRAFKPIADGK